MSAVLEYMKTNSFKSKEKHFVTVEKDQNTSGLEESEDALLIASHRLKITSVIDHIRQIGLPLLGQQYRLVTRRSFNAIEILEYITQQEIVVDLKLAIYSINHMAALLLVDLLDSGRIKHVEICMSNLRNGAHRGKEVLIKNILMKHDQVSLFMCSSHAKMMACVTENGNYYSIEGSGNHSANSRVEQYVIDNDRTIYEFNCQWMREIREFLRGKKELVEK